MTTSKMNKTYWRSLSDRAGQVAPSDTEFADGAETLEVDGVSRRAFMGLMGASAALAGVGAGCVRKPAQYILPYSERPEDLVPGVPRHFATNLQVGASALGLLVTSQDGRPTKVDGNPAHPMSLGATDARFQATVLDVYDTDRSRAPMHDGAEATWEDAEAAFETEVRDALESSRGAGFGLVVEDRMSPTLAALVASFRGAYPQAQVFVHDPTSPANQRAGLAMVGAEGFSVTYDLSKADVVVSLDADFLGTGADAVYHARGFATGRRLEDDEHSEMNRLYAIEPQFSVTGATADHRLQVPASRVGEFAKALAGAIGTGPLGSLSGESTGERFDQWVSVLAEDLQGRDGRVAILVGERQPAWVHAIGFLLNDALGATGEVVRFAATDARIDGGSTADLAAALADGSVRRLVIAGANPAFTGPADLALADAIGDAEFSLHLGYHADETAAVCNWHLPMAHGLEAWGDIRANDGTAGIQQPLIEPLFGGWSDIELVARMLPATRLSQLVGGAEDPASGLALVRGFWRNRLGGDFERLWRRSLHTGVVAERPNPSQPTLNAGGFSAGDAPAAPTESSLEVVFALDNKILDGRFANNAWMQEMPDPVTKITWDNAALIGPATARALGIEFSVSDTGSNDDIPNTPYAKLDAPMVTLTVGDASITIAAYVTPGVAENTIVLPLGYGRRFEGKVARNVGLYTDTLWLSSFDSVDDTHTVGFDTYAVRTSASPWIATGASLSQTGDTYMIATTQDHNHLEGRPLYREASLEEYGDNPTFVDDDELMKEYNLRSLWEEPNPRDGQQWGMSIDLSTCTGCNACTIACQAENNIPVVGKARIAQGREMAWIRLDRYYSGAADDPQAVFQPVACMHCENAPCEQVCPVAATVHGPEGTNDMAYNRCIGTRYCANNCPYKVRRFNFFNFNRENDEANPLLRLGRNPDVTVRFRGVMEKCTYCTQRISAAKIAAKVNSDGVVADGAITPACGQACPSQAIVFGDINDPNSRVSRARRRNRDYALLSWLNVHPRTTYLAKIRNPNPAFEA